MSYHRSPDSNLRRGYRYVNYCKYFMYVVNLLRPKFQGHFFLSLLRRHSNKSEAKLRCVLQWTSPFYQLRISQWHTSILGRVVRLHSRYAVQRAHVRKTYPVFSRFFKQYLAADKSPPQKNKKSKRNCSEGTRTPISQLHSRSGRATIAPQLPHYLPDHVAIAYTNPLRGRSIRFPSEVYWFVLRRIYIYVRCDPYLQRCGEVGWGEMWEFAWRTWVKYISIISA